MSSSIAAFTTSYSGLSKKLINNAEIVYQGRTFKTKFAQWDTGATDTCISENVVKSLNLVPIGLTNIQTPSGSKTVYRYIVDIILPSNVTIKDVEVNDCDIGKQGIDILIGMNIISLGDFAVSNYQNQTKFSFRIPSEKHTDYVQEHNTKI